MILIGLGSVAGSYLVQHLFAADGGSTPRRDRCKFAMKLSKVREDDSKDTVLRLLGIPDDIRRAPDPVPFPTDEIWCYGTDGHCSLATLGEVCFRGGQVVWVTGGDGQPPSRDIIDEDELCAGMRFLHPGPEAAGYNDPLHLIRVTNYLRPLGKAKSLAIIAEYGRIHDVAVDETWLFLLLRVLFEVPSPPGYMPEMIIGRMCPEPPEERKRIPRFPIMIVDDVPFSLLWGVSLAGQPQPIGQHIDYFQTHGKIRDRDLRPPDDPYPSLKKLFTSEEWNYVTKTSGRSRLIESFTSRTFLQLLALCRTAYDPPESRQPTEQPSMADYDLHHKAFVGIGARWDAKLQLYVRRDGTSGKFGHLKIG
jgi:hypothetical protein